MSEITFFKDKKKYLLFNIILFAFLILSINFNKEHLFPQFHDVKIIGKILGSLPNFMATLIVSLFILKISIKQKSKYRRIIFYIFSLIICAILTFEEHLQIVDKESTYDILDIVANILGMLVANSIFEIVLYKKK